MKKPVRKIRPPKKDYTKPEYFDANGDPKDWDFSKFSADEFDVHIRQQLPWYNMVTVMVGFLARHYLPRSGSVCDVGCSTGNMVNALRPLILERGAKMVALDENATMMQYTRERMWLETEEGTKSPFVDTSITTAQGHFQGARSYDVVIAFLTLSFLPVKDRAQTIRNMFRSISRGGALIIVDKMCYSGLTHPVLRNIGTIGKILAGASDRDLAPKEMSLIGVQRPLDQREITDAVRSNAIVQPFFQIGEFHGFVIEQMQDRHPRATMQGYDEDSPNKMLEKSDER